MRSCGLASRLIFAALAAAAGCLACSMVYQDIPVGPNFRVKVQGQGLPLKDLRIELEDGGRNRITALADTSGYVNFRGIKPGRWSVSVGRDYEMPDSAAIDVTYGGPPDVTVSLSWPSLSVVRTRSLKGTIRLPDFLPGMPQPELTIDVLEGKSGKRRETILTNDRGELGSSSMPPGFYYLKLRASEPIAVLVDPHAAAEYLDLDLSFSSCGLHYADAIQCRQTELRIDQLAGQVVDAAGGVFSHATVTLFDQAAKLVEQLQTDRDGRFTSTNSLPTGVYELVVKSPAFTPYRRTLRVDPNTAVSRPTQLTVRMGPMGACSAADTQ